MSVIAQGRGQMTAYGGDVRPGRFTAGNRGSGRSDGPACTTNNANAKLLLGFALHQLDRAHVTPRRRALAGDAIRHCYVILAATARRIK